MTDTTTDPTVTHADVLLRYSSIETLLRSAYSLTHRMHAAQRLAESARSGGQYAIAETAETEHADLRAQRDLIDAEIERRCAR